MIEGREVWRRVVDLGLRSTAISAEAGAIARRELDAHDPEALSTTQVASWAGVSPQVVEDLLLVARSLPDGPARTTPPTLKDSPGEPPTMPLPRAGERTPPTAPAPPRAPWRPNIPRRLGPYDLLDELGHGGMGIVFRARHEKLETPCAVKVMIAGEHASPEEIERFTLEARSVAKMGKHPNIVAVYDLDTQGSLTYFAMELVEGASLARVLREREEPFTPQETARLVEKVARAVHFAHEKGIIHRDLKPENVVVRPDGEPQVMDFGLAREVGGTGGRSIQGRAIGTPNYMAPEQARGEHDKCDARTDVYGLGGILYQALTGFPPHPGSWPQIVVHILRGEVVPPRSVRPETPRDLETICLKCLRPEQAKRYATPEALADDLARFQRGEPVHARPVGIGERAVRWVARHRAMSATVAVALAALFVVTAGFISRLTREVAKTTREAANATREAARARDAEAAERARADEVTRQKRELDEQVDTGYELAYKQHEAKTDPTAQLLVAARAREHALEAGLASAASWTDRLEQGFYASPRLVGGLGSGASIREVRFSPDGSLLAGAGSDGPVRRWDARTGRQVSRIDLHDAATTALSFSPDGATLASGSEDKTVKLWEVATGRVQATLEGHSGQVASVAFSPDGATLASGSFDKTLRLWRVGRAPLHSFGDVQRFAGATLVEGLAVSPLPRWRFAVPRLDFVATPGFSSAPSPEPPTEANDFLVLHWSDNSPYRWLPGAQTGDPESLHRLAVIRERQDRTLEEARELHQRCAASGDTTWGPRSKRRLDELPWLRGVHPPDAPPPSPAGHGLTVDRVVDWLKSGVLADSVLRDVQRDMELNGTVFRLTAADEQRLRDAGASDELMELMKPSKGK